MSSDEDDQYKAYEKDSRIPCRYGAKCYQKNPVHHEKFKHPPKKDAKRKKPSKPTTANKKRKNIDTQENKDELSDSPVKKTQKTSSPSPDEDSCDSLPLLNENESKSAFVKDSQETSNGKDLSNSNEQETKDETASTTVAELLKDCSIDTKDDTLSKSDAQTIISQLFLTEMPEDFYHLYELCKILSKEDPHKAFKDVNLQLVGPYDVFRSNFLNTKIENKEKLLRHWRYYFDPPEFQTILKVDDKDGLHFGYWRDNIAEKPVFVAKNKVNLNCLIEAVAENVFGAVDAYIEEKAKTANPFEQTRIMRLHQRVKNYAKEHNITLERKTSNMQSRNRKVVAKTFHKAGIVVPFDKKTELGYRDLAATDKELQKILNQIEEASSSAERKAPLSKLEEVVRLATIAADECDFGTCLELGHDLFASGVSHVQKIALRMLTTAYNLLQRPQFAEVASAHLKDRRKGTNLSVL